MKNKPILLISGEPHSIFLEIFFKAVKNRNYKSPLILISSLKLVKFQMKKFGFKRKINLINQNDLSKIKLNNKSINLININTNLKNSFKQLKINQINL